MDKLRTIIASLTFVSICLFVFVVNAHDRHDERRIQVALRMIGHQVLLHSGDSTSLVMPIEREGNRYKIQFASEFEFIPEELVATIDRVVKKTGMAKDYILEVEECETGEVVYAYEMDELEQSSIVPCQSRVQPLSCYSLFFTLLERNQPLSSEQNVPLDLSDGPFSKLGPMYALIVAIILLIGGLFFYMRKRRLDSSLAPHVIPLGEYRFDKRSTELVIKDRRIGLSGKEADLLVLLLDAVNTTVEREKILNMVWGDEGDYVGRTLDVFISRLRKKLDADSSVKIVNIRGIGYKLVVSA